MFENLEELRVPREIEDVAVKHFGEDDKRMAHVAEPNRDRASSCDRDERGRVSESGSRIRVSQEE